ncbi:MAG: hypothetical protein AAF618_00950 [Pseudomonadota bacterium]
MTAMSTLAALALLAAGTLTVVDHGPRGGSILLAAGGLQLCAVLIDAALSGEQSAPWDVWLDAELVAAGAGAMLSVIILLLMGLGIWHAARRRFGDEF